jgi:hypothetical protein
LRERLSGLDARERFAAACFGFVMRPVHVMKSGGADLDSVHRDVPFL